MILSGRELIQRVCSDCIIKDSNDKGNKESLWDHFNGWHFDLTLGDEIFITRRNEPIKLHDKQEYVSIRPGEFALLITEEEINVPSDLMAFINVRFSYKQKGLINISGFHVDPEYKGKLIFSVFNAGPNDIVLRRYEPVFMIFFARFYRSEKNNIEKLREDLNNVSKADDFINIMGEEAYHKIKKKNFKKKPFYKIPGNMMTSIQGMSVSLAESNARIEKLENNFKIYGSIAIGIIVALIGFILSKAG